jgi:hypothetical protein
VEDSDDLSQTTWTRLPPSIVATGSETQVLVDVPNSSPQRFYRVVELMKP